MPKPQTHFNTVDEDFTAYGLLDHRHTPEIEQAIGAQVIFTPHLAPMNRGILATCYARPVARAPTPPDRSRRAAAASTPASPFVVVVRPVPVDQGHPRLQLRPPHAPATTPAPAGSSPSRAIDNLTKGAAGQAIQCANLALGLPETAGLPVVGVYP